MVNELKGFIICGWFLFKMEMETLTVMEDLADVTESKRPKSPDPRSADHIYKSDACYLINHNVPGRDFTQS